MATPVPIWKIIEQRKRQLLLMHPEMLKQG
jgi:hypothetical protein